ncbi:hypothetical protein AB0M43_01260 [Longispora sp. NPDC051575]|uniref:hypothetical protein n=1 Tax=Longispora sp. NPDC051575 TaxID=3154943 RepID=UPI0034434560
MSEHRRRWAWLGETARVLAGAGVGGALGWFLSAVMDWSAGGAARECADADADGMVCFGLWSVGFGLLVSVAAVAVAWLVCAGLSGVRHQAATIPLGVLAALLVVMWFPAEAGRFHPTWFFALAMAVGFAALAGVLRLLDGAAGSPRRGWVALGVVLAVLAAAGLVRL